MQPPESVLDLLRRDGLFIDNELVPAIDGESIEVRSPATEEAIGRAVLAGTTDMDRAVAAARQAFDEGPWPRTPLHQRREVLSRAADLLAPRAHELSVLMSMQNGVTLKQRQGAVEAAVRYYASMPFPEPDLRSGGTVNAVVVHEPVGVVAAVVPWNSPGTIGLGKILPALLAGCTVVFKSAREVPLQDYVFAEALAEAGLPPGVLNVVPADREVSEHLVGHRDIDMVSFTGSTAAGRRIGEICGQRIRPVLLELGGKSAAIVLDDVDLDLAAERVLRGGVLVNNGQSCAAWSRLLVSRRRHDEFVDALRRELSEVRVGDPLDPETDVGPLISEQQRERVEGYIRSGLDDGAEVAFGGRRPGTLDRGWYVEPTLLVGTDNSMAVNREEIFGPVACVIPYEDLDEAVAIANDSDYGLSGAVFTDDANRGYGLARRIRTGTVGVNCMGVAHETPFGGFKDSGIGRCRGPEGLLEYLEPKTVGMPDGWSPTEDWPPDGGEGPDPDPCEFTAKR